jgi:hypothetical protein
MPFGVLIAVTCLLGCVAGLSIINLIYHLRSHLPLHKSSFLTVATAVRGRWWDKEMYGSCTRGPKELRERHAARVRFGVDVDAPQHVDLAPVVTAIERGGVYYGTMARHRAK